MSDTIGKSDLDKARDKARLVTAYHRTFETTEGQLVLEDLRRAFGTNFPAFRPDTEGRYDALLAAIRDGQRSVLLHVEMILASTTPDGDGNTEAPAVTVITEKYPTL